MSPSKRSRWSVGDLIIPAVILGTIALIVHIARPDTGTMFDDDNFGGTVVLGAVAILGVVASGFVIRALFRNVGLRGPCPSCGEVANWGFDKPTVSKPEATACGSCVAYLRATASDEVHEESFDHPIHGYPYVLTATQYKPAAKDPADTRRNFKFAMPTMCSICGDPDAPFKRTIYNSNNYDKDLFELANSGHAIGQVGSIPSGVTEDEKNDRRLGTLKSPVCAKHTEDADRFADPLSLGR